MAKQDEGTYASAAETKQVVQRRQDLWCCAAPSHVEVKAGVCKPRSLRRLSSGLVPGTYAFATAIAFLAILAEAAMKLQTWLRKGVGAQLSVAQKVGRSQASEQSQQEPSHPRPPAAPKTNLFSLLVFGLWLILQWMVDGATLRVNVRS